MQRVYRFDTKPLSTHLTVLDQIPANSKVLEIGTASGYMGEYLVHEKKCEVWGIEPVTELYHDAEKCGYTKLFNSSVEDFLQQLAPTEQFDVIIMADVLEHMVYPDKVLSALAKHLTPTGRVVISLPNVAHHSVRRHLLLGRWNVQDSGILDRTHLRFYNRLTAEKLITGAGLKMEKILPIVLRGKFVMSKIWPLLPQPLHAWWSNIFGYQHIFVAKRSS